MSGSSTLRICLVAMAPALAEVTARLRLQDTSVSTDSLASQLETHSKDSQIPVVQRSWHLLNGELHRRGGLKTPKEDRPASHLSPNGTHFDPRRSETVYDNTRSSNFTRSVSGANTFTNIKAFRLSGQATEAGDTEGGRSSKTSQLIDNLRIMNQPQIGAEKPVEQDKVVETDHRIVSEGLVHLGSNIKVAVKPPVMVNGDNDLSRKNDADEEISNAERKDLNVRKGRQSLGDQLSQHLTAAQTLNLNSEKMGICVQNNHSYSNSGFESGSNSEVQMDEKSKEDLRKECGKKQAYLERKVDILLRRLKRMKGKVVEAHTKEQLKHFVNFQHKNLQKVAKSLKNEAPGPDQLKEHFLSNEDVKNMSTAQLVRLVKTYQPNQTSSVSSHTSTKHGSSAVVMDAELRSQSLRTSERLSQRVQTAAAELDSDATASSSGGESGDEETVLSSYHPADLPPLAKRAEWKWAVDRAAVVSRWTWLQAQVSDLEYRIRQQSQVHRQLRNSKGGVVLGDQPTAVELFRRLQGIPSKQLTTSGDGKIPADASSGNEISPLNISAVMSNVDKQASRLTQSLGNCLSPASSSLGSPAGSSKITSPFVNCSTDSPSSTTTTCDTNSENSPMIPTELRLTERASDLLDHGVSADATCQAARCRPLRSYRKRKILRTIGLYKTSLKAARLSDVRCRCSPPATSCPICGGRYNNTLTVDPDTMSLNERVAILDPSFHPVLSFPNDIKLSIHCEGLLKSGLWQNKPLPRRSRVGEYRKNKVISLVTEPTKKGGNNQQTGRNSNSASVINFSTKIKNKYETKKGKAAGSKRSSVKPCVTKVKRKSSKSARALKKYQPDEDEDDLEAYLEQELSTSNARDGGLTGSGSQSSLKELRDVHHRKRKVDNSFDINNIVIPPSMAASTRVEQPQYKEIVTPKWREVYELCAAPAESIESSIAKKLEKTNGVSLSSEQQKLNSLPEEEVEEDLSDEKFAARHFSMEQEEKKRFRNFVQYPPARRNRARSDAIALSAVPVGDRHAAAEKVEGADMVAGMPAVAEESPMPSRPSTPVLNKSLHHTQQACVEDSIDSLQHQLSVRRRTMSFSKRERSGSIMSEDIHSSLIDVGRVEPWPRRTFPLPVEDYRLMREDLAPRCEPVHQRVTRQLAEPSGKVYVGGSAENPDDISAVASPHPSTESVSSAGDDPNDPEWVGGETFRRRPRRTGQDDLNDPDWTGSDTPRRNKNKR